MNPANANYSVILGVDPDSPYGTLLSHIGRTIVLPDSRRLLHFWCSEVDATHPVYLDITALDREGKPTFNLRLPHHQVLLITDPADAERMKIGFI